MFSKPVTMALSAVAWLIAIAYLLMPDPTHGQQNCLNYDQVRGELGGEYEEEPVIIGLTNAGGVITLFATDDGMTWSLILTDPDGCSQIIHAGEALIEIGKPGGERS